MGCCGKKLVRVSGKVKNIAKGNITLALSFVLPAFKFEFADDRIRACHKCKKQTWLTAAEYLAWMKAQGITTVIKNLDVLEKLPELPKKNHERGRKLCCMICKCFVPAKAYVKEEACPLGKWQG